MESIGSGKREKQDKPLTTEVEKIYSPHYLPNKKKYFSELDFRAKNSLKRSEVHFRNTIKILRTSDFIIHFRKSTSVSHIHFRKSTSVEGKK